MPTPDPIVVQIQNQTDNAIVEVGGYQIMRGDSAYYSLNDQSIWIQSGDSIQIGLKGALLPDRPKDFPDTGISLCVPPNLFRTLVQPLAAMSIIMIGTVGEGEGVRCGDGGD